MLRFMNRDVEAGGYKWTRFWRPLPDDFQGDVVGGAGILVGSALGALSFDSFAGFVGAVIGVTAMVIVRGVRRSMRRRGDPGP
jgi:hypothetical protein